MFLLPGRMDGYWWTLSGQPSHFQHLTTSSLGQILPPFHHIPIQHCHFQVICNRHLTTSLLGQILRHFPHIPIQHCHFQVICIRHLTTSLLGQILRPFRHIPIQYCHFQVICNRHLTTSLLGQILTNSLSSCSHWSNMECGSFCRYIGPRLMKDREPFNLK